jgi:signal transduction histidine kinase
MFETGIANMDYAMAVSMMDRQRTGIAQGFNRKSKEIWMATPSRAVSQANRSDEVERARCLEVFAASIVHEINQPLTALVANAEGCLRMLSATGLNLEGARDKALRMIEDASSAAAVMQRMRSLFAGTEANDEPVDLNETAKKALLLSSEKLQLRRVMVRWEPEADLPRITGDCLQLQQVILNLIMNAAEAMDEIHDRPRELVIRTQSGEGHVRLSVRDAGQGFAPIATDRLFDAFYTTKRDGMGVGLFLSRWIIENHRGAVSAALNDGPGATFSFSIPFRPA